MSETYQEKEKFYNMEELYWSQLRSFCCYVDNCDYRDITPEIYFELKARVKYAENIWDMLVSHFKLIHKWYQPKEQSVNRYFKSIGKAKMMNNKFGAENKIWE